MLRRSQEAKDQITDILRRQGYATYARLFQLFDFYFTDDDSVIAYMIPQKAAIVMNEKVSNEDSASVLVRHEILHEYLTHLERQLEFEKNHPELNPPKSNNQLANIAADFEISNRGYTDADKITVRNIMLGDKVLSGLVTEDHNKDWANMTFEEMYEELLKMQEETKQEIAQQLSRFGDLNSEDLEKIAGEIDELADEMDKQEQQQGQGGQGQEDQDEEDQKKQGKGSSEKEQDPRGEKKEKEIQGKLRKAAQNMRRDAEKLRKMDEDPLDTQSEHHTRIDIEARAKRIKDLLDDPSILSRLTGEVDVNIEKERIARTARKEQRARSSGLTRFTLSLNNFIKNEVEDIEEYSYAKMNPSYAKHGFIVPDLAEIEQPVPLINVYHDKSGSFSPAEKTEAAMRAIDTLQKYVRSGQIKIKIYYVTHVVRPAEEGAIGGAGADGNAIVRHIKATKPQNVIVITDGDADNCSESVTVPGAVWLLFYGEDAPNLIRNLRGKKESRHYMIEYN